MLITKEALTHGFIPITCEQDSQILELRLCPYLVFQKLATLNAVMT